MCNNSLRVIALLIFFACFANPVAGTTQERSESVLENEVRQDVEDLHSFFVGWYNGTLPDSAFETEFLARLDPDFTIMRFGIMSW